MNGKYMLITNKNKCVKLLSEYLMSREVINDLGEPLIFDNGDVFFIIEGIGFGAVNPEKHILKYMYIKKEHRGKGYFKKIYTELENQCKDYIRTVSTNMAVRIYEKYGFSITKSYKNYHNLRKEL